MLAKRGQEAMLSHPRSEQKAPVYIYLFFCILHRNFLKLKQSLRLCLFSVSITSCENAHKGLFFFLVHNNLLTPPAPCLLHADYKGHKGMALKCTISRGRLLSLLGEKEDSHPRGCFLDGGWSLLSWSCKFGRQDVSVPEARCCQCWLGEKADGCPQGMFMADSI